MRVSSKLLHKDDSFVHLLPNKLLGCNLFQAIFRIAHTFSMNLVGAASSIGNDISSLDEEPFMCGGSAKCLTRSGYEVLN